MTFQVFKSKERKRVEAEEARSDELLARVRFFPGPLAQYEALVGYEVRIIDTGDRDIGVTFGAKGDKPWRCLVHPERKKKLVESGIEALVECNYSLGGNNLLFYHRMYGLPVAKK